MNIVIWTIAITISIAGMFLIMNPIPNVAMAYNCSSSGSVHAGGSSTSVSGTSGSCSTSSASFGAKNTAVGGGFIPNAPNFNENFFPGSIPQFGHGASASFAAGGGQSSCLASSASQNGAGNSDGASQQDACSAHSPP